jgi:hypothetical protein
VAHPVEDESGAAGHCATIVRMEIFTRTQWRARGLSTRALKQGLERGEVRRVFRGVYAASDVPDTPHTRAAAARMIRPPGSIVVRESAAWLAGLDVLQPGRTAATEPLILAVSPDEAVPRIAGCKGWRAVIPADDLVAQDGIVRTNDLRTALDLGRFAPRRRAVASLDAFLHAELVTLEDLGSRAQQLVGVRNCRRLRANIEVADGGAESYAESEQRVLFIDAGLPKPRTQIRVFGAAGDLLGVLDMGWEQFRIGSEYDGEDGHDSDQQREHDGHRRGRIANETNWLVDVARKEQLWGQPAALVAHTAGLLLSRGWRPVDPVVLDQIARATAYEASSGRRWEWMPLDRVLAA